MKWEYLKHQVMYGGALSTPDLNAFGDDGWELVSAMTLNAATVYIFKRPKAEAIQ